MNTIPDAENFAKHVLWHLAGLRADMLQMQSIIFGWAKMQGDEPSQKIKEKWILEHKKNWDFLYHDALAKCKLQPPKAGDAPSWIFSNN